MSQRSGSLAEGFSEAVSIELAGDLGPLGAFPREAFDALVGIVLREIIDPTGGGCDSGAVVGAVKAFAAEHAVATTTALQRGIRGLVVVLQEATRRGATAADVRIGAGVLGLAGGNAAALGDLWQHAMVDGGDAALPEGLGDAAQLRRLVDLEWKFGVTAASSEAGAGAVGRTFLQLKLVLDAPGGGLERIYLELSLDQFYAFLAHMERAKAALVNVAPPA